ncbi:hypothetical protein Tco_0480241 [Tanacetum coccineum]
MVLDHLILPLSSWKGGSSHATYPILLAPYALLVFLHPPLHNLSVLLNSASKLLHHTPLVVLYVQLLSFLLLETVALPYTHGPPALKSHLLA